MQIYPFISWQFLAYFFSFVISIYCSFYLPGALLISRQKLGLGLTILLSFCLGLSLWGFQGFVFGYLQVRAATYLYLIIVLILSWRKGLICFDFLTRCVAWVKGHVLLSLFVTLGIFVQMSAVIGSGVLYPDGIRFFGVNRADGIMHLAFIQSIMHHFPPIEPGAYGHQITNYHYWSDLIISDLIRIWGLPITHTFFQYFPLLLSILTGLAGYQVVKALGFSNKAGIWALFFLYFGGDATYALTLIFLHKLYFLTPALDNGASQFLNMPNALAKIIFMTSIVSLKFWLGSMTRAFWGFATILLFSSLVGIKIYYALFVILGFVLMLLFILLSRFFDLVGKKGVTSSVLKIFLEAKYLIAGGLAMIIISALIYLPVNSRAGGLIWSPLEWPKVFLGKDVLNWAGWWSRTASYQDSQNFLGTFIFGLLAIMIFLVCVHGTRLLGVLITRKVYRVIGLEMISFLMPGLVIFHILGLFTLQVSGGLNVFNFFVVGTVVLSLLSGMILDRFSFSLKKPLVSGLLALLVIITLPRVAFEVSNNINALLNPVHNAFLVTKDELAAFNFIRKNTPSSYIIQASPENAQDSISPYVAFFSDRFSYLSGIELQETHHQALDKRKSKLKEVFTSKLPIDFFGQARAAGINLVYLRKVKEEQLPFKIDDNLITKLYENNSVVVLKVDITR